MHQQSPPLQAHNAHHTNARALLALVARNLKAEQLTGPDALRAQVAGAA
jgi:hypothetical protein